MEAIILTKSVMNKKSTGKKGSCVTAYAPYENRFVRFVSDTHGSPIPYQISARFSLLDIVSVQVLCSCSNSPQTENLLVDTNTFSVDGKYQMGIESIVRMAPSPHFPRYMDDWSYKLDSVKCYSHSLELVPVSKLRVFQDNRNKVKADFQFHSRWRKFFSVTDPYAIQRVYAGEWYVGNAYVAVSIPTETDDKSGSYFKFIAAIYPVHEI